MIMRSHRCNYLIAVNNAINCIIGGYHAERRTEQSNLFAGPHNISKIIFLGSTGDHTRQTKHIRPPTASFHSQLGLIGLLICLTLCQCTSRLLSSLCRPRTDKQAGRLAGRPREPLLPPYRCINFNIITK